MKQTTILAEKILYQDDYTKVVKLKLRKPDGKNIVRVKMEKRPFVVIVPIDEKGNVLLCREFRSTLQKTVWMVPAGFIDQNESSKQAARRELLEETNFKVKRLTPLYQLTGNSEYQQQGFAFLATQLTKIDGKSELQITPTDFNKTKKMALKNKLGDRIGLIVVAAIEKYKEIIK
ncbi:MAG: NUDIX hydrolase [bacterium]